LAAQF